jgi:hypothetical protein
MKLHLKLTNEIAKVILDLGRSKCRSHEKGVNFDCPFPRKARPTSEADPAGAIRSISDHRTMPNQRRLLELPLSGSENRTFMYDPWMKSLCGTLSLSEFRSPTAGAQWSRQIRESFQTSENTLGDGLKQQIREMSRVKCVQRKDCVAKRLG